MFGELSRKYNEHINNLVESVERVSYALFVHEPGHAGHLYICTFTACHMASCHMTSYHMVS